jgi:hypothetical protein
MAVEHWMMFGNFTTQRHFVYPSKESYDGVLINANMAAYAPDGLASFLLEKTANIKYIIDPITHAFQHNPDFITNDKGEVKKSIQKMAEGYDFPGDKLGKEPVTPEYLLDPARLKGLIDNCLRFQSTLLSDKILESDEMKYFSDDNPTTKPDALVIPYFYMTESTYDDWLKVLALTIKLALKSDWPDSKLFGSIVINRGILTNDNAINDITQVLIDSDLDGYLLWINDFYELGASESELKGLLKISDKLRDKGKREVINKHGSYFSVLAASGLGNNVLSGVTHGPEFGEYREVVPVGGGIPIARYYIPELHDRIRYRDAARIFKRMGYLESAESFHNNVCKCDRCIEIIKGNADNFIEFGASNPKKVRRGRGIVTIDYPTRETTVNCLEHYLQRKKKEYTSVATKSTEELLEDLERGRRIYEIEMGIDSVGYLKLWHKVFSDLQ